MELDITWEENSVSQKEQTQMLPLLREGVNQALLMGGGSEDAEVGLVLVNDETIKRYNKDYRGIDSPTDVLSFAMQEKGEGEPDLLIGDLWEEGQNEDCDSDSEDEEYFVYEDVMLGDILISVERAQAQAKEYGHSFEREMVFLAVHGTLHLLGFDHGIEGEATVMRQMEEQVMEKLGLLR